MSTVTSSGTDVSISRRSGNAMLLGVVGAVAGGAMFIAALCGAYVSVRTGFGKGFVPTTMKFNNYAGVMTLVSGLIASFAAEWALVSLKVGKRRWVSGGYGLAALMSVAAMNLIWLIGSRLGMAVNESVYATLVYALLAAALALFAVGVVACIVSLMLSLGGHASTQNPRPARAANWLVHLATLGWLAVFALIFLYK